MSLIIDLYGSYEKAKEELNWIKTYMWASKEMWMLEKELLEYRRKNNIFEYNDSVVSRCNDNEIRIFSYQKTVGKNILVKCKKGKGYCYPKKWFSHATNEEIKSGHRINNPELEELELIDVSPCCKKLGDCDE